MKLFSKESQLDEMQESMLHKIESRGYWLAWIALLVALLVQTASEAPTIQYAGEFAVFMLLSVYGVVEGIRNGIWDRHLSPSHLVNLLCSLVATVVVFAFTYFNYNYLLGALFSAAFTFIACIVLLEITSALYKKRHQALEQETPESEEE